MKAPTAHGRSHAHRRVGSFRRGFTIVEVLVAVGITAVLAAFMVSIVSNVSSFWGRTSGRISAEAQGRFILDQITLDLQSALYRDDGNTWLAATVLGNTNNTGLWNTTGATASGLKPANAAGSLQGIATANLSDARFGIGGTWLRFFTVKRGSNASLTAASAPVAVAYQIVRRATSGNEARSTDRRYLLHRSEVRPTNASTARVGTLESGFNITATAYAPTSNTATVNDPAEIRYPTINSVVAENVIDLGVRFYVRDTSTPTGLRTVFPLSNTALTYAAKSPSSVADATDAFPDVIDVMVRVLTDEGARVLAGYEASPQKITVPQGVTAQAYWWQLALANSQVFTRRIVVNAKPI
jgi:prepilin-type N-terminal cleavage/methylation domain-containing protein